MTNSELFTLAHHETRKALLKAKLLDKDFNYQVTFSFYIKELINNDKKEKNKRRNDRNVTIL